MDETKRVVVSGREVEVRTPDDKVMSSIMLDVEISRQLKGAAAAEALARGTARLVVAAVVNGSDISYIMDALASGEIEFDGLYKLLLGSPNREERRHPTSGVGGGEARQRPGRRRRR